MNSQPQDSLEWLRKNRTVHDALFERVDPSQLVAKVRDHRAFLKDATQTDTSWVGLYLDGFADRLEGSRVLELGPGNGLNALIMAALGAEVVAIDVSQQSIRILRTASRELGLTRKVRAIAGDFAALAIPAESFDFVVGKALLHHLTHEQEAAYLAQTSTVLRSGGEARFVEPAVNSRVLDLVRWVIPVPGRPSILNRRAFATYALGHAHPKRDDSSRHCIEVGRRYFGEVDVVPIGSLERFHRFLPRGESSRRFRRWAFRFERSLPHRLRWVTARTQTIILRHPRSGLMVVPIGRPSTSSRIAGRQVSAF